MKIWSVSTSPMYRFFVSLLGVTIDYKLSFDKHISNPASKAGACLKWQSLSLDYQC